MMSGNIFVEWTRDVMCALMILNKNDGKSFQASPPQRFGSRGKGKSKDEKWEMLKSMTLDKSQIKWLCSSQWSIVCDITHIKWKREQSENSNRSLSQAHTYRISLFPYTYRVQHGCVLSCVTEQQPEFAIQLHFFANLHNPYLGLIIAPLSLSTLFSRDCLYFLSFFFAHSPFAGLLDAVRETSCLTFTLSNDINFILQLRSLAFLATLYVFSSTLLSFIWSFRLSHIVWLNVVVWDGS